MASLYSYDRHFVPYQLCTCHMIVRRYVKTFKNRDNSTHGDAKRGFILHDTPDPRRRRHERSDAHMTALTAPRQLTTHQPAQRRVLCAIRAIRAIRANPCESVRIRANPCYPCYPCYSWGLVGSVGKISMIKTGGQTSVLPDNLSQPSSLS